MDSLCTYLQSHFEGKIDFVGQEQTEKLARSILWAFTGISFLAGFFVQSLRLTFIIFTFGIVLALVLVLPAYPVYNTHPIKWLPRIDSQATAKSGSEKVATVETKKDR
ncbi:SPC12-domain-containing protein [Meredithblackwellia eburnea MCA 4105]